MLRRSNAIGSPTEIVKEQQVGTHFGASRWRIADIQTLSSPYLGRETAAASGGVSGIWTSPPRVYYVREEGIHVWWLCLLGEGDAARSAYVFAGTRGDDTAAFEGEWVGVPLPSGHGLQAGRATFIINDLQTIESTHWLHGGRWRR